METKENLSNNVVMPQYDVLKQNYTTEEKILLDEIRENLVDLAISSGENFQPNKDKLLNDIKVFLFNRFSGENQNKRIPNEYLDNLSRKLLRDIIGYGKIDSLIQDDELEEIMIIGINKPVYVYHRKHGMMKTNIRYDDEQELTDLIDSMARQINRRIDKESPILDGRLSDGSRINATIPPVSADGPSLTIRKFKKDPLTIIDLINSKTLSLELAAFLWLCFDGLGVRSANAIISGGTSSGKTTTLNALASSNVENKGELTMNDLVKNSLRQRPDRIIVGEVRGEEAITLFTALNTGHSGFGTLHSNSARETITRLTTNPMSVPKIMIQAIDFIIMQKRIYTSSGVSYRRISEVAEIVGSEEGVIQLNKIFEWNPETDSIENVSISSKTLTQIANLSGKSLYEINKEIENRELLLKHMANQNIHRENEVNTILEMYYANPQKVLNRILLNG